jgi:hypothetical protein
VRDYDELYPHLMLDKELEARTTSILGWDNAERARILVSECQARYAATSLDELREFE